MSPFSMRIREEILASFPAWRAYTMEERWENSDPYLVVTVPAPLNAGTHLPLRISTWDDEITIDFDYYHTHLDRWNPLPGDSRHQSAMLYVQELMAEVFAVASWWNGDHCKVCGQVPPGGVPAPAFAVAYTRVRVRSWNGTHNLDAANSLGT